MSMKFGVRLSGASFGVKITPMSRSWWLFTLAFFLLYAPLSARAQTTGFIAVSSPNTDNYPEIQTFLKVHDGEGRFITGLGTDDIQVLENGEVIRVQTLDEIRNGMQMVLAINPGTTFAVRDANAITRFDYLVGALGAWADTRQNERTDDLSIIAPTGISQVHLDRYAAWKTALGDLPTDYRSAVPNMQILAQAIDIAADPTPRDGMGRAVLFITPNLDLPAIQALESLTSRAAQSGVRIYVWMVASPLLGDAQGAAALQSMASQTGGAYFAFSGVEEIPDLETYFEPLRWIYSLTYQSDIVTQGEHEIAIEIDTSAITLRSSTIGFQLDILPPNPIFVSPPTEITRAIDPQSGAEEVLIPNNQAIEILIEFPDGYTRELARTSLYVNGEIVAENTSPPFDVFDWDISAVQENGRFSVVVEAEDDLGLRNISLPTPIDIMVQRPPDGFVPAIARRNPVLSAVLVGLTGSALILLILVLGRRAHGHQQNGTPAKRVIQGPDLQPKTGSESPVVGRRITQWASQLPNRLNWPARRASAQPLAYLQRLSDPNGLEPITPTQPLAIYTSEVTLGTDPNQSTLILEDDCIEALHARLVRDRDGKFSISDHGSIAGTWINFQPTNGEPCPIEHGDQIHLGRIGFRFLLENPAEEDVEPIILYEKIQP